MNVVQHWSCAQTGEEPNSLENVSHATKNILTNCRKTAFFVPSHPHVFHQL